MLILKNFVVIGRVESTPTTLLPGESALPWENYLDSLNKLIDLGQFWEWFDSLPELTR